jgi:hypothetical protein
MHASTAFEPRRGACSPAQPGAQSGVLADVGPGDRRSRPAGARGRGLRAAAAALLVLAATAAQAHKRSDAYLFLDQPADRASLRRDIARRDLDAALALDADGHRALAWGEVRTAWPCIDTLALQSLGVAGCNFAVDGHALAHRNDGLSAVLQLSARCRMPAQTALRHSLFADIDTTPRGIVRHTVAGGAVTVRMLVPQVMPVSASVATPWATPLAPAGHALDYAVPLSVDTSTRLVSSPAGVQVPAPGAAVATPAAATPAATMPADPLAPSFTRKGVHHIVTGCDHLLFLLCRLLPAVLR